MDKMSAVGLVISALIATTSTAKAEKNLLFILDSSGSMWGQVDGVAKITTAKTVLNRLLGDLPPDVKAGLMVYGHRDKSACDDIQMLAPMGSAQSKATAAALDAISPKGKTPIAGSLTQAEFAFGGTAPDAGNSVVLISDGIETCEGDPCAVAEVLASRNVNVKVHVVGFDISQEDREQLECIAEKGKGSYFSADSTDGFVDAVTQAVKVAAEKPKPAPAPAPAPTPAGPFLLDEFDGDSLAGHWEVINEDPDSYIVEDGKLLIVGMNTGNIIKGNVSNIVRYTGELPKGDWVATIKFSVPYQTGRETPFLALYDNNDNHIAGSTNAWSYYNGTRGSRVYLTSWKRAKGEETLFNKVIWGGASGEPYAADEAPNPIYLRLTKKGRSYTSSYRLEGMNQTEWDAGEKVTALRPKGNLAIGIYQSEDVKGETPMSVDWFRIDSLE